MIMDERLEFADATALDTSGTNSDLIGDVIDLGSVTSDVGNGQPIYLVLRVNAAVTSAGSATVVFTLASDAQAAIAVDGSQTTHFSTAAIALSGLTANSQQIMVALPVDTYERYLGIVTTTGTAALTGGSIDAYLTYDPKGWVAYPDATN